MKHFLDTSVARHIILGSTPYKKYLLAQFGDNPTYISKYVQMEFNRGYLCNIIDFYFTLHLSSVPTISDAMKIWSDKFSSRELKAVIQLAADLFNANRLDFISIKDKSTALRILESYIKRIALKFRKSFKDIGANTTRCARALIDLSSSDTNDAKKNIQDFQQKINSTSTCRNECNIGDFITRRFKFEIDKYIKNGENLLNPQKPENKGFISIIETLKKISEKGEGYCTCTACSKIGDAIIALELPTSMRLETLDYSFEHLCPPLNKSFKRHISQSAVIKSLEES